MTSFHFVEGITGSWLLEFDARESRSACVKRDAAFLSIATTPTRRARTLLQSEGGLTGDRSHSIAGSRFHT